MLTPTHGFLANLFSWSRKLSWGTKEHFLFYFGAILPDIPSVFVGTIEFFKYLVANPRSLDWLWIKTRALDLLFFNERPPLFDAVLTNVGYHKAALWLGQCLHSVFFWLLVLALCKFAAPKLRSCAIVSYGAIFFHVFIDWLTHTKYAHSYFWPISDTPVPGLISSENPFLFKVELFVWFIWILFAAIIVSRKLRRRSKGK